MKKRSVSSERDLHLGLFNCDIFGRDHAVNAEAKIIARSLAKSSHLYVIGKIKAHEDLIDGAKCSHYSSRLQILRCLKQLKKSKVRCVIIQAPLTADGLIAASICGVIKLPVLIQDFGQITRPAMTRKLFSADPDVRRLESEGEKSRNSFRSILGNFKSRISKKFAVCLLRILNVNSVHGWLTFSSYSDRELEALIGVPEKKCIHYPWAAVQPPRRANNLSWYEENQCAGEAIFRFVFWSRIDYWLKGVDRAIRGFAAASERNADFKKNARLLLIGPDYQAGANQAKKLVDELGMSDEIQWLPPGTYPAGSLDPLASADASVLLSRWDGFPRALRESLGLGLPLVISPETHFGDIVNNTELGYLVEDPDDPKCVADGLISVFSKKRSSIESTLEAYQRLDPDTLAKNILKKVSELFDIERQAQL